jgi:hypothetical protein
VLADYRCAIEEAEARLDRLTGQVAQAAQSWRLARMDCPRQCAPDSASDALARRPINRATSRLCKVGGRARSGSPRASYVADARRRRPNLDGGSPRRTHGNAVTNPRIRACEPSSQGSASCLVQQSRRQAPHLRRNSSPIADPVDGEHKS